MSKINTNFHFFPQFNMLLDTFVFATTHWYRRQLGFRKKVPRPCCTHHLLPHLLTADTFLHLIPSYTVVQPLTLPYIFFPFSQLLIFLNCHFLWNSQMITSNCKKNRQILLFAFHITLMQDMICHKTVLELTGVLENRQCRICCLLIWL